MYAEVAERRDDDHEDFLPARNTPKHRIRSQIEDMVLFTIIARVADGLPLAATMQDNEQVRNMMKCHPTYR